MKFFHSTTFKIILYIFAIIGVVFASVFVAMQFGLLNVRGSIATRNASLGIPQTQPINDCTNTAQTACTWNQTVEWGVLKTAFTKDAAVINEVSQQVGISPRLLVATVVPEQIRYFTANRESFKKYFEPLKILSSLSKFSLGVSGIKEETANQIEAYANDATSPFYPGADATVLITYPAGVSHDTELYNRLTDSHNHYYSYLYTALFIKEIQNQWAAAGFDVSQKPEVVVTLFNIGFKESIPHATPTVAGAAITLAGHTYVYGELGTLFFNSTELRDVFPQ